MKKKICFECEEELSESEFGSNGKSYNGSPRLKPRCKKCNHVYETSLFEEKLHKAIGGAENLKCTLCGYNTYSGALEFHHLDPSKKEKPVSLMKNYSYEKLKKEIDKCVILCGCCHPEVHAGIRTI
jgi:hypothetical protein